MEMERTPSSAGIWTVDLSPYKWEAGCWWPAYSYTARMTVWEYGIDGPTYTVVVVGGLAAVLMLESQDGRCPIGVLLDRLEEEPEECDCPPELLAEVVAWLRERHPNGV